jgi:hypothetical protein
MKKFEYKIIPKITNVDNKAFLNLIGQNGWELVSVTEFYFYLKREII